MSNRQNPGVYIKAERWPAASVDRFRLDVPGFVGVSEKGPLNRPVTVESLHEYEAIFGTPIMAGYLSDAVTGFFHNGGRRCWIVRSADPNLAVPATHFLVGSDGVTPVLQLLAKNAGVWGQRISVALSVNDGWSDYKNAVKTTFIPFSLTVTDTKTSKREYWSHLNLDPKSPNFAPRVLGAGSNLIFAQIYKPKLNKAEATTDQPIGISAVSSLISVDGTPLFRDTLKGGCDGLTPGVNLYLNQDTENSHLKMAMMSQAFHGQGQGAQHLAFPLIHISWRGSHKGRQEPLTGAEYIKIEPQPEKGHDDRPRFGIKIYNNADHKVWGEDGLSLDPHDEMDLIRRLRDPATGCGRVRATRLVPDGFFHANPIGMKKSQFSFSAGLTPDLLTGRDSENGQLLYWSEKAPICAPLQLATAKPDALATEEKNTKQPTEADSSVYIGLEQLRVTTDIGLIAIPDLMPKWHSIPNQIAFCGETTPSLHRGDDAAERWFPPVYSLDLIARHQAYMLHHCAGHRFRFAILDMPPFWSSVWDKTENGGRAYQDHAVIHAQKVASKRNGQFGSFFGPSIAIKRPDGRKFKIPASGHVAGIVAQNDFIGGVQRGPAHLRMVGLDQTAPFIDPALIAEFQRFGINLLKTTPSRGVEIGAARTLFLADHIHEDILHWSPDKAGPMRNIYRHINVSRTAMLVEKTIVLQARELVFEGNTPQLWSQLRGLATEVLRDFWEGGGLAGDTKEGAYYVRCDETTTPPDLASAGHVVCLVGFRPVAATEIIEINVAVRPGVTVEAL